MSRQKLKEQRDDSRQFGRDKDFNVQQTVHLGTKIKEGNKVQIQQCKTTRICHDIEVLCRDNNYMQL